MVFAHRNRCIQASPFILFICAVALGRCFAEARLTMHQLGQFSSVQAETAIIWCCRANDCVCCSLENFALRYRQPDQSELVPLRNAPLEVAGARAGDLIHSLNTQDANSCCPNGFAELVREFLLIDRCQLTTASAGLLANLKK